MTAAASSITAGFMILCRLRPRLERRGCRCGPRHGRTAMSIQALEWPKVGNSRVPYRVFADPEIYRAELDRIFLGPSWQYLALADELPEPGDYETTFLGETPIIVTRGEDGEIHAMLNRCAHRGNLVCLKQRGHTKNLTCVYHAWRYDLEGN